MVSIFWQFVKIGCNLSWCISGAAGICSNNTKPKKVPEVEKIRKRTIKGREAKIERHSKPKGERGIKESKVKKRVREALLDKHNRPKDQRKRKERR